MLFAKTKPLRDEEYLLSLGTDRPMGGAFPGSWKGKKVIKPSISDKVDKSDGFNPAVAGVFRHPPLAGGGGVKRPQSITREPIAAATQARRQTKARDKMLPIIYFNLNFEVTCQVRVRSQV